MGDRPAVTGKTALRRIRALMRAKPDEGEGVVESYPTIYEVTYPIGWGWKERVSTAAFAESIGENPTLPLFWEHLWDDAPFGTGEASDEQKGVHLLGQLYVDLDPKVARLYRSMKDGAITEWSIAFIPTTISADPDDPMIDIIEKGELIEASMVVRGANPATETIDVRRQPVTLAGDAKKEVARIRSLLTPDSERIDGPEAVARAWDAMASRAGRDLVRAARSSGSGRSDS